MEESMEEPLKILSDSVKECGKSITFTMDEVDDLKIRFENMETWYRTKLYEMQGQIEYCLNKLDKLDSVELNLKLANLKIKELEHVSNSNSRSNSRSNSNTSNSNLTNINTNINTDINTNINTSDYQRTSTVFLPMERQITEL